MKYGEELRQGYVICKLKNKWPFPWYKKTPPKFRDFVKETYGPIGRAEFKKSYKVKTIRKKL